MSSVDELSIFPRKLLISVSLLICEQINDKDLLITASSSCGMNIIILLSLLWMTAYVAILNMLQILMVVIG